jgi:hypothetical protein
MSEDEGCDPRLAARPALPRRPGRPLVYRRRPNGLGIDGLEGRANGLIVRDWHLDDQRLNPLNTRFIGS